MMFIISLEGRLDILKIHIMNIKSSTKITKQWCTANKPKMKQMELQKIFYPKEGIKWGEKKQQQRWHKEKQK